MHGMRILSWNVNGLRAAIRKGIDAWIDQIDPDVVMLQEIRCRPDQLTDGHYFDEWHAAWNPAEKAGYAGTAVFSRRPIRRTETGINAAPDPEGRALRVDIDGADLVCVYLPSGSSSDEAQVRKQTWMRAFKPWTTTLTRRRRPVIIGGDLNIARDERDIFHWKSNQNTSGFLPHERAWMNGIVESGWTDLIREDAGDVPGPYSWWSNRGQARELDRGWRIDYLLANGRASRNTSGPTIDRPAGLACSDHAPVIVDLG